VIKFTATDWLKTAAMALVIVLLAVLGAIVESYSSRSGSKWRFLRTGLQHIDSEMRKRDETMRELTSP